MTLTKLAFMVENAPERNERRELDGVYGDYYRPYYGLLTTLAAWAKYEGLLCVELGVEKGRGCASMAVAGADVLGIDNNKRPESEQLEKVFFNLKVLQRSSIPPPADVKRKVGVLHLDTEHSYAQAREELKVWAPLLSSPAVLCFDDLHAMNDQVAHFFYKLSCPKIADDRLHECGYGVALWTDGTKVPE